MFNLIDKNKKGIIFPSSPFVFIFILETIQLPVLVTPIVCQYSHLLPISTQIRCQGFSGELSSSSLPDQVSALCKFQPLWQARGIVTENIILLFKLSACTLILLVLTISYLNIKENISSIGNTVGITKPKLRDASVCSDSDPCFPAAALHLHSLVSLNVQAQAQIIQRLRYVPSLLRGSLWRWGPFTAPKGKHVCKVYKSLWGLGLNPHSAKVNTWMRERRNLPSLWALPVDVFALVYSYQVCK